MQTTSTEIATVIKNKTHLYNVLAKSYYLPNIQSKAITKEYLQLYCLEHITIFTVKREEIVPYHYRQRRYSSMELLDILEGMLKESSLKSTGLGLFTLPDREWMQNCILFLNPSDPFNLLDSKLEAMPSYTLKINEE